MAKKPLDDPNNVLHYLLTTHAPLIQKHINSLRGSGKLPSREEMEDWELHEAGMRGLMEAVHKYKPEVGSFQPYAEASIRGRIQSHADSMHQIPKHIRMQAKRFGEMQDPKSSAPVTVYKPGEEPKQVSAQEAKTLSSRPGPTIKS